MRLFTPILLLAGILAGCGPAAEPAPPPTASTSYDDLLALHTDWRAFQPPVIVDGVPDYSLAAMAEQHRALAGYQARLATIDPSGWPVNQQVDYHIVRAEMNGLDFDHRMLRPWENNPAFYTMLFPSPTDVPAREGPVVHGAIELSTYTFPLAPADAEVVAGRVQTIAPLLDQARAHLTGDQRDLWVAGIRTMAGQAGDLDALAERAAGTPLEGDARAAAEATRAFVTWLEAEASAKTGASGVGVENYDWFLKNVMLVPYTWADQVAMMKRELARAHAALKLEEHRNHLLPELEPIEDAADYDRNLNAAVTEYMAFLEEQDVVTIKPYMDAALRARIGTYSPPVNGRREFFGEANYRDGVVMRTHGYHWFDLARMVEEPHESPIRREPLLYNIFVSRAEGMATGMEEMMMHAGLFDSRPRARELIYVLLAQRAARALGDLYMHANTFTMDEAIQYASEWTPRGWLPTDGQTVWFEQHLYLQQPMYGTSYLVGKIQIEELIARMARQQGDSFTLKGFMDAVNEAGMIPMALIAWELTGDDEAVAGLVAP
ncbi:MAG: DUF885 family protein [Rhodothermales bacterium]|nr:DUF885 family protein [Rhodothermales bacterium]